MPIGRNTENPYRVGNPIKDPDQFFGRGHELASIFQRIEKGECTSLVGERRIGRTSLLWQVMNENVQAKYMDKDHGCPFVYMDCQLGVQTPEGFFYEVFRAVKELDVSFSFEAGDRIGYKRQVRDRECLAAQITSKKSLPLLGWPSATRWLISAHRSPIWVLLATAGHRWRLS